MFNKFHHFLLGRSQWCIYIIVSCLLALIGAIDYLTGSEISFSIFYLLPIVLAAWYGSSSASYVFCVISSIVWYSIDHLAAQTYSHYLIPYWNAAVRLGFFITTSYLLCGLKMHLLREQKLARVDGLTGLYNSRAFRDLTDRLVLISRRHRHSFALGYIDVDNFKQVNDNFGHTEGDRVLHMVGEALRTTVRGTDIVGRLGGDEFAVALPETGVGAARVTFAKIRAELQRQTELGQWPIGFSIGVVVFTEAPETFDAAINAADKLMYQVKSAGKGQVEIREHHQG